MKCFDKIAVHFGLVVVTWLLMSCHVGTSGAVMTAEIGLAWAAGDETRMSIEVRRHMERGHELEKSQDFTGYF